MDKKFIKTKAIPRKPQVKKLSFHQNYNPHLKEIMKYSVEMWGKRVAKEFLAEIKQKIITMRNIPNIYGRCSFVDSTDNQIFRNIIVRSYYIVYVVTPTEITVLDIIHQAVAPENIKKRIENIR
ncbi:MAG: type II toxin-antitoxin system RelE/ParE family toxin [Prevotellaceae bacterium]|jgi:plasmid stabilization system protein ParE|nr:type II toxin-antitoxin system RelE/ParE family toxin [Prevotellaceae bacterium]